MKWKTVREGQEAIIHNYLGEAKHVIGPKRVFLFRESLKYLQSFTASADEYLAIRDVVGKLIHKPGPCQMFLNPTEHSNITVKSAIKVDANQCIVVYKKKKDSSVERRIVDGPNVFVPEAEEWLHEFKWHEQDSDNPGHMIPNGKTFTKMASTPDQFFFKIRDVRTTDDTMIIVKLMIFYQLEDLIKMLEATHDPIADMINAVCADVISFAGKLTLEGFLQNTKKLSEIDTYTQLTQRANHIGYHVTKVVYRGYHSSDSLQAMQDSAIKSRTHMRLQAETSEQNRKLMNFRLNKEQQRAQTVQKMEKNKLEHQQHVEGMKQEHKLSLKKMEHEAELEMYAMEKEAELGVKQSCDQWKSDHLSRMKADLDINLTRLLVSQQTPPVDEEIHVVPPGGFLQTDIQRLENP